MQHLKKKERVFEDYIRCLKSFHQILPVMLFLETDICISETYVRRILTMTYLLNYSFYINNYWIENNFMHSGHPLNNERSAYVDILKSQHLKPHPSIQIGLIFLRS